MKKGVTVLLVIALTFLLFSGTVLASVKGGHGHGKTEQKEESNTEVVSDNNTEDQNQDANNDDQNALEVKETKAAHGHGSKNEIEKNFMLLYIFLLFNILVLVIAGIMRYSRRKVAL